MSVLIGRRGVKSDFGNIECGSAFFGCLLESREESMVGKLGRKTSKILSTTTTTYAVQQ